MTTLREMAEKAAWDVLDRPNGATSEQHAKHIADVIERVAREFAAMSVGALTGTMARTGVLRMKPGIDGAEAIMALAKMAMEEAERGE